MVHLNTTAANDFFSNYERGVVTSAPTRVDVIVDNHHMLSKTLLLTLLLQLPAVIGNRKTRAAMALKNTSRSHHFCA